MIQIDPSLPWRGIEYGLPGRPKLWTTVKTLLREKKRRKREFELKRALENVCLPSAVHLTSKMNCSLINYAEKAFIQHLVENLGFLHSLNIHLLIESSF